jgi:hypothetical protein
MKYIFTIFSAIVNLYILNAQVKVGDTGTGFYHAVFNTPYILKDTIYDFYSKGFSLDLNGDGINDIKLESHYYWRIIPPQAGGGTYPTWACSINSFNDLTEIVRRNSMVDTLRLNDTINSTHNLWFKYVTNSINLTYNINNSTIDSTWKDQSDKYIGFRIMQSNDTSYGWLSISVTGYTEITIKEYACQSSYQTDTVLSINTNSILKDMIKIYPIPFKDYITIFSANNVNIKKVEFISIEGILLKYIDFPNRNLLTSDLKPGVYVMVIHLDNNEILRKNVIKL